MFRYKEQMLDKEKNILAELNGKKAEIENNILDIEEYRSVQRNELQKRQKIGINVKELYSSNFMLENTKLQVDGLKIQLIQADREIEDQIKVVLEISKEISGLEKLETKQREEHNKQVIKDNETQILEHIMSKMKQKNI